MRQAAGPLRLPVATTLSPVAGDAAGERRSRVLHVITALGVGGAEHMLLKLLAARALGDFEQRVVALLPDGALAARMRATGAAVDELDLLGGVPVIGGTLALARLARAFAPHVVHGWMYHGNLGASVARRAAGRRVPLIWGIRQSLASLDGENAYAKAAIRLGRLLSRDPDRILFNSRTSLQQHRDDGFHPRRMEYLPNGFDTERFAPDAAARARVRSEWGAADADTVFGMVARYHPAKNHAGFLRAAGAVAAARPGARFVLAGPGVDADHPELAGLAARLGIAERVRLLGAREDVPSIMAGLDVYVSASTAIEAFSNAIGEALCAGVPCIATAVGDSPTVIGRDGLIVQAGDVDALAGAMVELVDAGPQRRCEIGQRGRERMQAEYGLEAVAGRYAALYRELIDARQAWG